jgi:hypothetical protein
MSETTGIVVILGGLAVSAIGLYVLSRSNRQVIGLVLILIGFSLAGTGLLTLESTEVVDRPPATVAPGTPEASPPV